MRTSNVKAWGETQQRTETRLERHRSEFELNQRRGALLGIEELDPDELNLINASFFNNIRERGADDINAIYEAYVETLHMWGVMCPHPIPHRLYDGWQRSMSPLQFEESRWYSCTICGSAVINK